MKNKNRFKCVLYSRNVDYFTFFTMCNPYMVTPKKQ